MIKIYNRGVLIAQQVDDTYIEDTGTGLELPFPLWGFKRKGKVKIEAVRRWAMGRVPPETRLGLEKELERLGVERYSKISITEATDCGLVGDHFTATGVWDSYSYH